MTVNSDTAQFYFLLSHTAVNFSQSYQYKSHVASVTGKIFGTFSEPVCNDYF